MELSAARTYIEVIEGLTKGTKKPMAMRAELTTTGGLRLPILSVMKPEESEATIEQTRAMTDMVETTPAAAVASRPMYFSAM